MKVTYNWLKDFVEIKIPARQLADKLTMAGLEVTSLEERDGDFVFEIEVTSNRPDCLSVIGIAREIAAITGKKLKVVLRSKDKVLRESLQLIAYSLQLAIEDKQDCPLYTAKIIRDVNVAASPDWLRKRLELVGCPSVNNIVDITNYILFTWGEPLHAFDLDKLVRQLAGSPVRQLEIIVRRACAGDEIITIDGIRRKLDNYILVIAVGENNKTGKPANRQTGKPIAMAGVMGGQDTEVTVNTKNILLEAAIFNPIAIRHARQKLGLHSESAYRFERGVDLEIVQPASWQAVQLIQELAGGNCVLAKSAGMSKTARRSILLDLQSVQRVLGTNVTSQRIKSILVNLGFKIKAKSKVKLLAEAPSHRPDARLEIDLIEEIARIFGYDNIPQSLPAFQPQISAPNSRETIALLKDILVGLGLNEVITYSLIDKYLLEGQEEKNVVEIANPLSSQQEILRPTIIPSLIQCVALNLNQKENFVNIFEVAKAFCVDSGPLPKEELVLGIALCGIKSWLIKQGLIKDEAGLLHLKGVCEALFIRLGIKRYSFSAASNNQEAIIYVQNERAGVIKKASRAALDKAGIKNKDVFVAEVSLEQVFPYVNLEKKFQSLPVYPGISRDISFLLKEDVSTDLLLASVRDAGRPWLREAKIVDYYKGKQIPSGYKGLTLSCLYRADERTLTEAEINPVHSLVCNALVERFVAKIRV